MENVGCKAESFGTMVLARLMELHKLAEEIMELANQGERLIIGPQVTSKKVESIAVPPANQPGFMHDASRAITDIRLCLEKTKDKLISIRNTFED